MSLATLRLINAVFYAHHGVMVEEHRVGGRYEVDVSVDFDVSEAAQEDDLTKTVDYERVYEIVREQVTQRKHYLIERLAYLITEAVLDAFDRIEAIEVTVRKVNPPVGGPSDRAEVTYRATREKA